MHAVRSARIARLALLALIPCLAVLPAGCGGDQPPSLAQGAAGQGALEAGFARADITPTEPVKMAGYGVYFGPESGCRWSRGVHDPLYARAAALHDPVRGTSAVLVVLDSIGAIAGDIKRIADGVAAETGLPAGCVLVSSTHTHHGPDMIGLYGTLLPPATGRQEAVVDHVVRGAVLAGVEAWNGREPATVTFAVGAETTLHENRIEGDADATIDHTATLLEARRAGDGALLGTLLNWPCHPTVMGEKNRLLSADFVGAYGRRMVQALGGGVHLFVNGAIGASIEPIQRFLEPDAWDEVDRFGRVLTRTALRLMARARRIADPALSPPTSRAVPVTVENAAFALADAWGLIPREVPPLGETADTFLTTFALGPVRFGTLPGEYVPDYSFRLREILGGEAQVIVGLGMDWIGYAVTPRQYDHPSYGYERLLCPGREAGEAVLEAYAEAWADGPPG